MVEKDKVYIRTKVLLSTRLAVFLDKYKEDYVAELLSESIEDAVSILFPSNGRFSRVQRDNRRLVIMNIAEKILFLLGKRE